MANINFNPETGEIIEEAVEKDTCLTLYVGTDIKHLSECITRDRVMEYTSQVDMRHGSPIKVNYPHLLDYTLHITPRQMQLLTHLCESVFSWNYYSGCTKELATTLDNSMVARDLKMLESMGLLHVVVRGNVSRTDIMLTVTPALTFKGGYDFRENALRKWYSPPQSQI